LTTIRLGTSEDTAWLIEHDHHVTPLMLQEKLAAQQILIAESQGLRVGWLRWGYFWDSIPFMNLLFVLAEYRGAAIGTQLVNVWEERMCKAGCTLLMTSTLSNEQAQHFYRRLGYEDRGALLMPQEPLEIIFIKQFA
jgi:ribosomal protein S18 acetylase RimI-like enzyme